MAVYPFTNLISALVFLAAVFSSVTARSAEADAHMVRERLLDGLGAFSRLRLEVGLGLPVLDQNRLKSVVDKANEAQKTFTSALTGQATGWLDALCVILGGDGA